MSRRWTSWPETSPSTATHCGGCGRRRRGHLATQSAPLVVTTQGDLTDMPVHRPRRLRATPAMRRLVAEHRLAPQTLIQPLFVAEGLTQPRRSRACWGGAAHARLLADEVRRAADAGVGE